MFCTNCGKQVELEWKYCANCGFGIAHFVRKNELFQKLDESKKVLFKRLKEERRKMSDTKRVPPFVIAHDAILLELCQSLPTTEDEMLKIHGVRKRKFELIKDFIPLILEFKERFDANSLKK